MKKKLYFVFAVLLFTSSAFVTLTTQSEYTVKEGFSIAFKSKDPSGDFKKVKGTIKFDEADLGQSKFDITIDVNSISTGNAMQSKKAQTEEWFEASKYPQIKYISTKVEKATDGYLITGNLTMKGVTKVKKITTKVEKATSGPVFTGKFSVNRIEFGVGKKSDAVPDFMNITFTVPTSKK